MTFGSSGISCEVRIQPYLNACISSKSGNLRAFGAMTMAYEPRFASEVLGMQNEAESKVLQWVVIGLGQNNQPAATQALERIALRSSGEVLDGALISLAQSVAPVKDFLLPYLSRKAHPISYWARFWVCRKCGVTLAQTGS